MHRFGNVKTNVLAHALFSEATISNNTYFEQFYSECAPKSCSYTNVQRRETLTSLLLLIAILDGLNKILRILTLSLGKFLFYYIDWWKERHQRRSECL